MSKFKLNKREKFWILYDVGNSAFTMLVSTLIPIYFNALASAEGVSSADYLAYWGYASSIATLLTAIILRHIGLCLELDFVFGDLCVRQGVLFLVAGVL